MTTQEEQGRGAAADSLVALVPVCWEELQLDVLAEIHPELWMEALSYQVNVRAESGADATFNLGEEAAPVTLHVDEPILELIELRDTVKQPFSPAELLQLEQHRAIWRLTLREVSRAPLERAKLFTRLLSTLVEAGAPAAFFPFCVQLHPGQLIRRLAMTLDEPQALVNLFINAWNDDEWMITRGLTVFGLPELETPIDEGLNAAYFRLMDVAASTLAQKRAYPLGTRLQLGPHTYEVLDGPEGPADKGIAICGAFGRRTLRRRVVR